MTPSVLETSEALHESVRAYARASLAGATDEHAFDRLALEIAAHQVRAIPGYRRLVDGRGGLGTSADTIPAVPSDAFRLTRVAAHPLALDRARFRTSGTTADPGTHAMRTTATYRELSLAWGAKALGSGGGTRRTVVALAPMPGREPTSSLAFMMQAFMDEWDGRSCGRGEPYTALDPRRWLASGDGVDVAGLEQVLGIARQRNESALILATGFALVMLLDALGDARLEAPPGTVVMPTGGFKARTREISPGELATRVSRALCVPETHVVFEYGMTELTSQLYEGTLPGSPLAGRRGVYVAPPWLRVTPVDPETLAPVPEGGAGLARFVDLGNVDSAVALVTQDLVRREGPGVVLLGRRAGAPLRGCSLAIEEMVLAERAS